MFFFDFFQSPRDNIFRLLAIALALLLVLATYLYYRYTSGKFIVPKRKNKKNQPILSKSSKKPIKMSVVGIDLGNLNTVVAVARKGGIDVITNDTSNRATPSLVCFGEKQRYLGEAAKNQEMSNFKSTVSTLKRLLARPFSDPEVANEKK
jgi:hypothetical protein